jgi:hypothetical protein
MPHVPHFNENLVSKVCFEKIFWYFHLSSYQSYITGKGGKIFPALN